MFSDLGNIVLLFIDEVNEIQQEIVFKDLPNVVTLQHIFSAMFKNNVMNDFQKARIDIISMDQYLEAFNDREIDDD